MMKELKLRNYINEISDFIYNYLKTHDSIVIAIDGKSGSGKTTLANYLKENFDSNVIHTDDYFLPLNLRTKERRNEIGGNINYEKFKNDVIDHLKNDITIEAFNCKTLTFKEKIILKHKKITIIEGSYALHPYFGKYYDYSIGIDIDSKKQIERLKKREGINLDNFINLWIPLENKYFDYFNIFSKVDLLIKNDN